MQKIFEGNRGEIFLIDYFGKPAVLKRFKNRDFQKAKKEANILSFLEPFAIAPKLYELYEDCIIMEYLEGISFKEALQKDKKNAIAQALHICYVLDNVGIYHKELGRYYHFILTKNGMRLLDFERAQLGKRGKNVLQFIGFYLRDLDLQKEIALYKRDQKEGFLALTKALDVL